jgi:hypothetical protein
MVVFRLNNKLITLEQADKFIDFDMLLLEFKIRILVNYNRRVENMTTKKYLYLKNQCNLMTNIIYTDTIKEIIKCGYGELMVIKLSDECYINIFNVKNVKMIGDYLEEIKGLYIRSVIEVSCKLDKKKYLILLLSDMTYVEIEVSDYDYSLCKGGYEEC